MADLNDLGRVSITDMSVDEALETIRQIRLRRRTATKKPKSKSTISVKRTPNVVSSQVIDAKMAQELLKLLGGEQND